MKLHFPLFRDFPFVLKLARMLRALIVVYGMVVCSVAAPLDTWTWREPVPFGFWTSKVLPTAGFFSLVGEGGYAGVSTNGRDWTLRSTHKSDQLAELFFANGRWFASGPIQSGLHDYVFLTSTNGLDYTLLDRKSIRGVAHGKGTYLAAGSGEIFSSGDGLSWATLATNDFSLNALAFAHDRFVGLGAYGAVASSLDGKTWSQHQQTPGKFLYEADGTFFVVGDHFLITSTNGVDWAFEPVRTPNWVSGGLFTGKTWIIYGHNGSLLPQISVSTNKTNWTLIDFPPAWRILTMAENNGKILAAGQGLALSEDGFTWENMTAGSSDAMEGPSAMAFGAGTYVAAGGLGKPLLLWSTNAIAWSKADSAATGGVMRVTYGGPGFVAGGQAGLLLHSIDGLEWTDVSQANLRSDRNSIWDLQFLEGKYYALARTVLLESSDGKEWLQRDLPGVFYSMARVGSKFAIAGPDAGLRTSEDLETWTYSPTVGIPTGLTAAHGKFFVSTSRGLQVSSDGENWLQPRAPGIGRVIEVENGFLGIGWEPFWPVPGSSLFYSSDGVQWRPVGGPGNIALSALYYHSGRLFALRGSGGIMEAAHFGFLTWQGKTPNDFQLFLRSAAPGTKLQVSEDLQLWTDLQDTPLLSPSTPGKFFRALIPD